MNKKHKGVVVYETLSDGCLNGVYSNNDRNTNNKIFNEIARKKPGNGEESHELQGLYTCCYIDLQSEPFFCDLKIINNNNSYELTWYEIGTQTIKFKGIGWCTRTDQLTVRYEDY